MDCMVCYNEIFFGIKGKNCMNIHTICTSCYFMNKSYRCIYCRKINKVIEIIDMKQNKTICITNKIYKNILLYYAVFQIKLALTFDVNIALNYIDAHKYQYIHDMINEKYTLRYLMIFHLFWLFGFGFGVIDIQPPISPSMTQIYCIEETCYIADFYYNYIVLKGFMICVNIILFIFSKWKYDNTDSIKRRLWTSLKEMNNI